MRETGIEHFLYLDVRHAADRVGDRRSEVSQRAQQLLSRFVGAVVANADHDHAVAVGRRREDRQRDQLVRARARERVVKSKYLAGLFERVDEQPAEYGPDRMKAVFERCDDAEIAAAAPQTPEEFAVFAGVCGDSLPLGGDQIDRQKIVAGKSVLAAEPAPAAAERQPGDAGGGDRAAGGGEFVGLRLGIELGPQDSWLGARRARGFIHLHRLHGRQVDHQTAIADGVAGDVVAAAVNREQEAVVAREIHGMNHPALCWQTALSSKSPYSGGCADTIVRKRRSSVAIFLCTSCPPGTGRDSPTDTNPVARRVRNCER